MSTALDVRAAIALLELRNRDAVRLGELVSLAARVEPEFLRAARIGLTPFDAAAEADLWFSQLVETRTADWIALAPAAARELRSALAADKSRLDAAHALITEAHSGAPATIILEEEILWVALTTPHDARQAIEERLRLVLDKLLEDPAAHKGLAHWFAGAARRLPEEAQATEAYALLSFVTSGLLDGRHLNAPAPKRLRLDALAGILPDSIPRLHVWATLTDYGLTLRPDRSRGSVPLEVPRTDPLLFEVRPLNDPPQFIILRRGETRTVRIKSGVVELRTAAGDVYRLRHRPREFSSVGMRGLILGFGGTGGHVLTALKELVVLKHGRVPDSIKFLLFDTIADWRPGSTILVLGGAAEEPTAAGSEEKTSLDPATEYFYLRDHDPDLKTYVYRLLSPQGSPEKYPHLKDWLHAPWLKVHVKESSMPIPEGAAQQRQIGRFAMFQNAEQTKNKITQLINELAYSAGGMPVNVWLIGSAAGGTGAGCLIDAAYLTRYAAETSGRKVNLTGVIVLPDVYNDVAGISRARAYSLFRELNRIQGLGIDRDSDEATMGFTSRVFYDARRFMSVTLQKGLFDDLFYLGRECNNDEARKNFFASVANSIDSYLDENSGPRLLQESVNMTSLASAMGGSRLYVPEETFADIFAWEQVEAYLRGLTAPNDDGGRLSLYAGAVPDREARAEINVKNLLALFGELLQRADQRDDANEAYVRNTVTPEKIVTDWFQFGGTAIAGITLSTSDRMAVQLTYLNPYISLTETDEQKVAVTDRQIKTYRENEKVKGLRETQEQSRDRFADQLDKITQQYTNLAGGERTFVKGLRQFTRIISDTLQGRVDNIFTGELTKATSFSIDPASPSQGTVLTRLRAECGYALAKLRVIDEMVAKFIAALDGEEAVRIQQPVDALNQLRQSAASGFFSRFSIWVESYQMSAREELYEYIRWYQKRELLKSMQTLVRGVARRFGEWQSVIDAACDRLVLQPPTSALHVVREQRLRRELYGRLHRLGRNRSARISCETFDPRDPDLTMQGYREELKSCVRVSSGETLAEEALRVSRWEALVNRDGAPELRLVIGLGIPLSYTVQTIGDLHQNLHDDFRNRMSGYLRDRDIFDYLLYVQRNGKATPDSVASILNEAAEVLMNASGGSEECRLIFRNPQVPEKANLAVAIKSALSGFPGLNVKDSQDTHSDKNSITLLKVKKPNLDQVIDLVKCRDEYLDMQTRDLTGDAAYDDEVYRAQVYHAFRAELEAWFIERRFMKKNGRRLDGRSESYEIPPRVVRLLDEPAMMQVFVWCLATGAVEKVKGQGWVWHDTANGRDVTLIDEEENPGADLVQAAVVFVLQQREGRKGGLIRISYEDARQSAGDAAQKQGKTRDEKLGEFQQHLDAFLREHLKSVEAAQKSEATERRERQERQGLHMILDFYSDPETRTALQHRMGA
jgi:hypothetical protein